MGARLALAAMLVLSSAQARADDDEGRLRLSVMAAIVPNASATLGRGEHVSYTAADRALAGRLSLDYACGDVLFLGIGSQYVYWLHDSLADGPAAGSETDLHARIGANSRLTESWHLFGYLAPGYSVLVSPTTGLPRSTNPRGLVVAGSVGTAVDLHPALYFTLELGYQEGFQVDRVDTGPPVDHSTRFVHVGMGLGLRLL
jgi:hypothetical protein